MQETEQRTIFGEEINEQVHIQTTGRTIRPFKRMIGEVAQEYRIHLNDDGLQVDVVDPANVIAIYTNLYADALEEYQTKQNLIGVNNGSFGSALQHARYGKSTDDPITITADDMNLQTEVHREFGKSNATLTERMGLIDPNAIRSDAELPELDLPIEVDLHPRTFNEAVNAMNTDGGNEIRLGTNPDSIVFHQEVGSQRNIEIDADPTEVSEFTHYSADYVKSISSMLSMGYVDSLTLRWGEDYPLIAEFEREDIMSGKIMLAPRIQS